MDGNRRVTFKPDLTWWDGSTCTFAGDAKYKNLTGRRVPNSDLYQMLSYATALDLPGGLLVYAQGEVDDESYEVRHADKRLEVVLLDLSGTLERGPSGRPEGGEEGHSASRRSPSCRNLRAFKV